VYGRGSARAGAQLELVVARLRAKGLTPQPKLVRSKKTSARVPKQAVRKKRDIYWPELGKRRATPVYDGEQLASGNKISGPAIVETADTTAVDQPGTKLRVDELGNFEMTFQGGAMEACTAQTGLLRKKPCGEKAVTKCGNCEQPLCGKPAVRDMSAG